MKLYFLFFGFTMYSVYFSHTTHRNLLFILYISQMLPTGICYTFCVILPCHPQGFALHSVHFTHATSKQSRSPESSQPHPSQQRRALHQLRGQGSGVWYGMVCYGMLMACLWYTCVTTIQIYFLFRVFYISPTPPARICCVFCTLLPHHAQGFIVYFAYFSHATHRDLLCILHTCPCCVHCISLTPPTRIYYVFCILLPRHPQGFTV